VNDIITQDLQQTLAAAAVGAVTPPPLATLHFGLYVNNVALTPQTVLTDLVDATFDGYAQDTVTGWVGPYKNLAGDIVISPSVLPAFHCTGTLTANSCKGYYAYRPDTTVLQIAGQFDTAITPTPGQRFSVVPEVAVQGTVDSSTF
jgi:hypothetical protein